MMSLVFANKNHTKKLYNNFFKFKIRIGSQEVNLCLFIEQTHILKKL